MSGEPSGLKDPARAVRGVGAGALALEAVVLLLAIQPMRVLGGTSSGAAVGVAVGAAVVAAVLAALTRSAGAWVWWAGAALQVALVAAGFVHWALAVLGVLFGLVWAFLAYVRTRIL